MASSTRRLEGQDFDVTRFPERDDGRLVFSTGAGPGVLLLHELPGLSAPCLRFAIRLAARGFRVHLPLLFGELLDEKPIGHLLRLCISREFGHLRGGRAAPVADELRALAAALVTRGGGRRIGVIGMCLTGGFVIPLVIEPGVLAGVMSQPSIPFRIGHLLNGRGEGAWMRGLNVSTAQWDAAARAVHAEGKHLLVQRIDGDRLCPRERLDRLREGFGAALQVHEDVIERVPDGPLDRPHALLTNEYERPEADSAQHATRVAFERVVTFLHAQLA